VVRPPRARGHARVRHHVNAVRPSRTPIAGGRDGAENGQAEGSGSLFVAKFPVPTGESTLCCSNSGLFVLQDSGRPLPGWLKSTNAQARPWSE